MPHNWFRNYEVRSDRQKIWGHDVHGWKDSPQGGPVGVDRHSDQRQKRWASKVLKSQGRLRHVVHDHQALHAETTKMHEGDNYTTIDRKSHRPQNSIERGRGKT